MQENHLSDIELNVHVEIGQVSLTLRELMELKIGDTFQTTQLATNVKLVINGRHYAEGFLVDVDGKCAVRITRLLATTVADLESHSLSKNELISPMPATQNQHQFVEFGEDNELERYRAKNQDENFDDDYNENDDYDYNDENEKNN